MSTILTVCACGNQNDEDDEPVTTKETGELSADTTDDTKEETPGSSEMELPGETDSIIESCNTTLIVKGATAKIGDTLIEVAVGIKNNPGILGIDFDFDKNKSIPRGTTEELTKEGSKVKAYVFFRGRSILFKEQGEVLLLRFANDLEEYGKVEMMPVLEGKRMTIMLSPVKNK